MPAATPFPGIESHALIGDRRTAALVAGDGSIDFLCWPEFDSPTIFASLLDREIGGSFELTADSATPQQHYLPDSNLLRTIWQGAAGEAEVIDLLPWPARGRLIRRVTALRGTLHWRMRCAPRGDYGRVGMSLQAQAVSSAELLPGLHFSASLPFDVTDGAAVVAWSLPEGQSVAFVLHEHEDHHVMPEIEAQIAGTLAAWRAWVGQVCYAGAYQAAVRRSALMLALLVSDRHGAILAAPTFGLPESPGGARNWDYRFCWIRDGSLIANAFLRLGLTEEATAFHRWVRGRQMVAPGRLAIFYAPDGGTAAAEVELAHLSGHNGAKPVRIGNGARDQLQLDIHGELLDSIARAPLFDAQDWRWLSGIVEYVCRHWREIDAGIWELRGGPRSHLHSRLLCWVALDRALSLAQRHQLPAPLERWTQIRTEIDADIHTHFRHPDGDYLTQAAGSGDLDAAELMLPLLGFLQGDDPLWQRTLAAIERELTAGELVYRYRNNDGLPGEEGAFVACCFWRVQALAVSGRQSEAETAMQRLLARANPLGLFAEEIATSGRMLGNFPQGLSHAALIDAACAIVEAN